METEDEIRQNLKAIILLKAIKSLLNLFSGKDLLKAIKVLLGLCSVEELLRAIKTLCGLISEVEITKIEAKLLNDLALIQSRDGRKR